MNTLLMIIAIHALLVGFGLVLGGIMAIAAPQQPGDRRDACSL
jgi:hypothetical protein